MRSVRKILVGVYKWARQDSEPPSCCIDKALKEIKGVLPDTVEIVNLIEDCKLECDDYPQDIDIAEAIHNLMKERLG